MQEQIEYPRQFGIQYQRPGFSSYISFNIYREPERMSWNGYYQECRIRLWFTGDYWIVAGYKSGIEACYFRTNQERIPLGEIEKLIQCACFYIDITNNKQEES